MKKYLSLILVLFLVCLSSCNNESRIFKNKYQYEGEYNVGGNYSLINIKITIEFFKHDTNLKNYNNYYEAIYTSSSDELEVSTYYYAFIEKNYLQLLLEYPFDENNNTFFLTRYIIDSNQNFYIDEKLPDTVENGRILRYYFKKI